MEVRFEPVIQFHGFQKEESCTRGALWNAGLMPHSKVAL
jgi:hypothetical protein